MERGTRSQYALARTREHNIVEREVVKEPATLVEEVVAAT